MSDVTGILNWMDEHWLPRNINKFINWLEGKWL